MPIYAYSPELRLEFRRQHRREVVRKRAARRRQRAEKPRDIKTTQRDWLDAIDRDKDIETASRT